MNLDSIQVCYKKTNWVTQYLRQVGLQRKKKNIIRALIKFIEDIIRFPKAPAISRKRY